MRWCAFLCVVVVLICSGCAPGAAVPGAAQPTSVALPTSVPTATTAPTAPPIAITAPTNTPPVTTIAPTAPPENVPAGDCGGLEQLSATEALQIAQANAANIIGSSTSDIKITSAEAWKFDGWLVVTVVTDPIGDAEAAVLRPQGSGYAVAGFVPPVAPTPEDYSPHVNGIPLGLVPCWLTRGT